MSHLTAAHWWKPTKPDETLPGVLFEDDERGWVLQLDGSFEESFFKKLMGGSTPLPTPVTLPSRFDVLVGTTSGGKMVSLLDCQVLQGSPPFGPTRGHLRLWPRIIAYDIHFDSYDDFRLVSLRARYTNLDAWAATSGFSATHGPKFDPFEVRYSLPDAVEVLCADGVTVGLSFSAEGLSFPILNELHLVQHAWLKVTSPTDQPFDWFLSYLSNFANLMSLAVGQAFQSQEMAATAHATSSPGGDLSEVSIGLVYNRKPIAHSSREIPVWDMLFTLSDVRNRFDGMVRAWFSRDEKTQSLYDLYFGTVRSPAMYVEHRFLNMFQALESYDRRTFEYSHEKKQAYEQRLKSVMEPLTAMDRKWLKRHLRSNEPMASDRLKRLVQEHDAQWLLKDADIDLATNLRNYLTHFDQKLEALIPPANERVRAMHNLAVRLQILCELVLLRAVGLSLEEMRIRMEQTHRVEGQLIPE